MWPVTPTTGHPNRPLGLLGCYAILFTLTTPSSLVCMKLIELNINKIIELCRRFHVRKLWVFGSILTSRFRPESDIDFCVDFDKSKIGLLDYADNFFDFQYALEDLFGHKVDITEDTAVRNPYFRQELNETRKLIYG